MSLFNRKDKLFQDVMDGQVSFEKLSANEQKEAQAFMHLRQDLRMLSEIPEHQMSNERMRDAILAASIQKKSSSSNGFWNVVWVPTAACAFVVAYFGMSSAFRGPRAPQIRMGTDVAGSVAMNSPSFKLPAFKASALPPAPLAQVSSNKEGGSRPAAKSAGVPVERQPSGRTASNQDAGMDIAVDSNALVAMLQPRSSEDLPAPSDSGSIVVIDNPGAAVDPQAIETGGVKNVVIGG